MENKLAEALPYSINDVLDEMSSPLRATGGGSAAAIAGAMSAALGALVSRLLNRDEDAFNEHRRFFRSAADRDGQAFAALMRTEHAGQHAIEEAIDVPLGIAERAAVPFGKIQSAAEALLKVGLLKECRRPGHT